MTEYQTLQLRLSEIRQRLNELSAIETELNDEQRAEVDRLTTEFRDKETRARAALVSEQATEDGTETETDTGDGESAEFGRLVREVRFGRYVAAAVAGRAPDGVERELQQAVGVESRAGGVVIPWQALDVAAQGAQGAAATERTAAADGDRETRADAHTTTAQLDGAVAQRRILPRLFGRSVMEALGVRLDEVPAGRAEWPIIATGVSPAQRAEASETDATAVTFNTQTLRPKRLDGAYRWTPELAAEVPEIEEAARADLAAAIAAKMYDILLNGAAYDADNNPENITGLLTAIAAPTTPTDETEYAGYAAALSAAIDGLHAEREAEVSAVLGVDTAKHAAATFHTGSGESGMEAMRRRGGMVIASSFIPAAASNVQAAILHGGADMARGDSVAAVWPGVEVIRDPYQRDAGVRLQWVVLWDARVAFRAAAYTRVSFKLA